MLYKVAVIALILTFCSSCSTQPKRPKEVRTESFLTDIKEDGTKLFIYIANFTALAASPGRARSAQGRQMSMSSMRSDTAEYHEKLTIDALEYKLLVTGYCRYGYFVLNTYNQFGSVEIRGECQETATDADRKLFL